jgi:uracil phosphoribosyltransferase
MELTALQNPLADDCLAVLRDHRTTAGAFRSAGRRISLLLAVEAGKHLSTKEAQVESPLESTACRMLAKGVVLVPILRAGLGMVDAFLELLPDAEIGHVGLERNEQTAEAGSYYCKLPELVGKQVFLLDPMLATGGSLAMAANVVKSRGAKSLVAVSIIAAPEGVKKMSEDHSDIPLIIGVVDRELDTSKYIRPGLGDYGDRLMGTN